MHKIIFKNFLNLCGIVLRHYTVFFNDERLEFKTRVLISTRISYIFVGKALSRKFANTRTTTSTITNSKFGLRS